MLDGGRQMLCDAISPLDLRPKGKILEIYYKINYNEMSLWYNLSLGVAIIGTVQCVPNYGHVTVKDR